MKDFERINKFIESNAIREFLRENNIELKQLSPEIVNCLFILENEHSRFNQVFQKIYNNS